MHNSHLPSGFSSGTFSGARRGLLRLIDRCAGKPAHVGLSALPQNLIEPLEQRQMLSSITHPHTGVVIEGEFHTFTAKTPASQRTFTDGLNNKILFTLSGVGSGMVFQADSGEIVTLELSETNPGSNLSVNVVKGKSGTGFTTLAQVQVNDGGLGAFKAANVNLTRSFTSEDAVGSLVLGNVGANIQANITIGGTHADKTTITAAALENVSIRTNTNIVSFKALDWQDSNDIQDSLEASSLGALGITGRAQVVSRGAVVVTALPGDFEATINLTHTVPIGTPPTSPQANPKVNAIAVSGSTTDNWVFKSHKVSSIAIKGGATGTWSSNPGFGSVTVAGQANALSIITPGDIGSFKAGRVSNTTLDADGIIGGISTVDYIGGFIAASKVGSITTTGKAATVQRGIVVAPAVAGDFTPDMLINNVLGTTSPTVPSVGSISIKGSATGDMSHKGLTNVGDWIIAGGVGSIRIAGSVQTLFIDVRAKETNKGNIGSITIDGFTHNARIDAHGKSGDIRIAGADGLEILVGEGVTGGNLAGFNSSKTLENVTLDVRGGITAVNTTNWNDGAIKAHKIGSINVKATKTTAGEWDNVGLNLTGAGVISGQTTVGQINVAGKVLNSVWRVAKDAGTVSVAAYLNSTMFVGIAGTADSTVSPTGADFVVTGGKTSTLVGFTVTGRSSATGHASFSNSQVAAGTLIKVSLKLVDGASANAFGVTAGTKIGTYTRQSTPNTVVRVNNKTLPGVYDTVGMYSLKVVDLDGEPS